MSNNKNNLLNYTIYAGHYLGLFWVFKYLFVIFGQSFAFLALIGNILSIGTPILLFYFLVKYNTGMVNGTMSYGHGIQFSILLFFFASVLEAIIVFIHVKWLEPGYISNLYTMLVDLAQSLPISTNLAAQLAEQPLPSSFSYVFSNVILADVFLGLILSLIIVPLAQRVKINK